MTGTFLRTAVRPQDKSSFDGRVVEVSMILCHLHLNILETPIEVSKLF